MDQEMTDVEAPTTNGAASDILQKRNRPVTLKFEDVVYRIKSKKQGLSSIWKKGNKEEEEKIILKGVNGIIEPGEVLAMLGPSGSGKTTLLTALGGRLGGGKLQGTITYNGQKFSNSMKRNTGFVTQDDVLYPHLTVTETLVFTALLRLPNMITKQEKILQAESVITQLGLTNCKDSIIGNTLLRGVSGGERKRVSIGQEMLVNPSLLFLDEPTSGLDSTTAQRIVSCLWELANKGKTVVMTIHQPSSRLYYMFHKVMLLSEGSSMYFGKGSEAIKYFSNVGFSPAVAMNPADFLLDLANGVYSDESTEDHGLVKSKLKSEYRKHIEPQLKEMLHSRGDSGQSHLQDNKHHQDREFGRWPTTWSQQLCALLRRGVKERRHESFSALRICQILIVAIICGLLWYKSDISHLQDQVGLLFFVVGFWGFIPMFHAIFTFPQELMMLQKERSSGTYRLSSYFMSRMVGDLPMELVLPTIFLIITYWMASLKPNFLSFFFTLLSLLFTVLVSQGLGLALGASLMDQKTATTLGSVIMLSFMLAAGFYVQNVPKFIAWIKYLSISHYTFKLFVGSQYGVRDTYPCSEGHQCLVADFPSIKQIGVDLKGQILAALALGIMLVGYRLLAYLALMRIGVTKKLG